MMKQKPIKVVCVEEFGITMKTKLGNKVDRWVKEGELFNAYQLSNGSVLLRKRGKWVIAEYAVYARNFAEVIDDNRY